MQRENFSARDSLPRVPRSRDISPPSLFLPPVAPRVPATCAIALARPARMQHSRPPSPSARPFRLRTPCTRQVASPFHPPSPASAHPHSRPLKRVPVNPVISRKLPPLSRPRFSLSVPLSTFLFRLSLSFFHNKFAPLRRSDCRSLPHLCRFALFALFALLTIP